jgi:hypothetical protein
MSEWKSKENAISRAVMFERLEHQIIHCEDKDKAAELLLLYKDLNGQDLSFKLPYWAIESLSVEAKKQGMSTERYCMSHLIEAAADLGIDQKLLLERWKLTAVLRNKLVQLQSVLAEYSHAQASREKSATCLVDSLFS